MSTTFTYGLILAAVNVVLTLTGFFLGYHGEKMAEGEWFKWTVYIAIAVVTFLGIRAVRENAPDKSLSYGKGLGSGVLICLWAGLIGAVFAFCYFKFINPTFVDYLIDFTRAQQASKHLTDAQMEQMEKGIRFMMSPVVVTLITPFFYVIVGLVVSLIAAAILKRPAPQDLAPPVQT